MSFFVSGGDWPRKNGIFPQLSLFWNKLLYLLIPGGVQVEDASCVRPEDQDGGGDNNNEDDAVVDNVDEADEDDEDDDYGGICEHVQEAHRSVPEGNFFIPKLSRTASMA